METGFVSLNKGTKTNLPYYAHKEVRWGNQGNNDDVIFKITDYLLGKTLKLSYLMK